MPFTPPIKGTPKQKRVEQTPIHTYEGAGAIVTLIEQLKSLKTDIERTKDRKMQEIDAMIEKLNSESSSASEKFSKLIVDFKEEVLRTINEIHSIEAIKGEDGEPADEEKIIESVLQRIDQNKIVREILAQIKIPKEEDLLKKFVSKIPQSKASLKVIRETFSMDPEELLKKILALPDGKFKLHTKHIDGLEQTISAFRHQLAKGYLHGGGISNITGLIQAGTNITLSGSGTTGDPYIINSGDISAVWGSITGTLSNQTDLQSALNAKQNVISFGSQYQIPFTNATSDNFDYDPYFYWNTTSQILTVGGGGITDAYIKPEDSLADATVTNLHIKGASVNAIGTSPGGNVFINGGSPADTGIGGSIYLIAADGGTSGGDGGLLYLASGSPTGINKNGGDVSINAAGGGGGTGIDGNIIMTQLAGKYTYYSNGANYGILHFSGLTNTRTYTLPDADGTLALTSDIKIGTKVSATNSPSVDYIQLNKQVLSQAGYTALYSQIGLIPDFTTSSKTILTSNVVDVAYNGSVYVAVINNPSVPNVWTSTDGLQWDAVTDQSLAGVSPVRIVWFAAASKFVAVATQLNVYVSSDGKNWNIAYPGSSQTLSCLGTDGTTLVVAGAADAETNTSYAYETTDLVTWTRVAYDVTSSNTATTIYYWSTAALFFIGTSTGKIYSSSNTTVWTARTSNVASSLSQFTSSAALIVAVGAAGVITTSTDGLTWTAKTAQTATAYTGAAYLATATYPWVAFGSALQTVSPDGLNWYTINAQPAPNARKSIFYGNGKYISIGVARYIANSTDLVSWTYSIPATGGSLTTAMSAGAYGNSAYVIVGASGKIDSSADGVTFTNRTANAGTNQLNDIIYAAGTFNLFITVGAGNILNTSPDGTTWTAQASNIVSTINSVAFDATNNVGVAVGTGGKITRSVNGTTWAAQTSPTTNNLNGVARNGSVFCAIGAAGTCITSADGITWTKQYVPAFSQFTLNWITSDGTNFYATTSNSYVYISSDGINWSAYASAFVGAPLSINYMNSKLVMMNSVGDLIHSTDGKSWTMGTPRGVPSGAGPCYTYNNKFLITSNIPWISTDGLTFQNQSYNNAMTSTTYHTGLSKLFAVGSSGTTFISSDGGANWTWTGVNPTTSGSASFTDADYSAPLGMVAFITSTGGIYTSTDLVAFTQRATTSKLFGVTPAGGLNSIKWGNGLFVTVGSAGLIFTSPDGLTWTEQNSGTIQTLNQVDYNSSLGLWIAVGGNGISVTSSNGISWTPRVTGIKNTLNTVITLESKGFIIIDAQSGAYLSTTGTGNWRQYQITVGGNFGGGGKGIYSSIDNAAFIPMSASSTANALAWTQDGMNYNIIPNMVGGTTNTKPAYDSVNDRYVSFGTAGTYVVTYTRSYNRATEFILPNEPNTWIKAL